MDISIVLPESEVAAVTFVDADVYVRFSAGATRKASSAAGEKPSPGFSKGIVLQLRGAQFIGQEDPKLGRVSAGRLQLAGEWRKEIPVPFEFHGQVHFELTFANGAYLIAGGSGISLRFEGEPNFAESLAC